MINPARIVPAVAVSAMLLASCVPEYTPLEFAVKGDRIVANGTIDAGSLAAFEAVADDNPAIRTLLLQNIAGSVDDEANLAFSRVVRESGFDTIVPSDGMVASGGTDLFLAGNRRILEPGACVGVHSWGGGWGTPAAELPRDHREHRRYLDYYRDMAVNTAFYWFTLDAAPASEMHWMTAGEADRFGLGTGRSPGLGTPDVCEAR